MPAYKDNKRNTWYVVYRITDWNGKVKQKTKRGFKTKKEALEYERQELSISQGLNDCLTLEMLANRYIDDCKLRLRPTTVYSIKSTLLNHFVNYFEEILAKDVDFVKIKYWQGELLKANTPFHTMNTYQSTVSSMFKFGVKFCGLKSNPMQDAGTVKSQNKSNDLKFWTKEQYKAFISVVDDFKMKVMFDTLYYSGMRVGECLGLKWQDILWDSNTIKIDETLTKLGTEVYMNAPKTDSSNRTIVMPQFYMDELKKYQESCYNPSHYKRVFSFTDRSGYVRERFYRYIAKTDLPLITIHDLRHSHASLLIDQGMPITVISARLGHANISTTLNIYSHMFPDQQKTVADKLDELF